MNRDHSDVATSLNDLAGLYCNQHRYADAEALYQRALAIREKALSPEHPDVATSFNNLAELYRTQGQYAKAEPLYRRALAIREKALGPEHPDVANSLNNLAQLLQATNWLGEAEPLMRRALGEAERKHLLNLAHGRTSDYRGHHALRSELRRLRSMGLLVTHQYRNISEIRDDLRVDLSDYVFITNWGKEWAKTLSRGADAARPRDR